MLVKSNSVPNFLFEKPISNSSKTYNLTFTNNVKNVLYVELKNNQKYTKYKRTQQCFHCSTFIKEFCI